MTLELVAVAFGDARFLVPPAVADQCARLRAVGNAYAALTLARDNHAGAASIVPDGTRISVPLALCDHLPQRFREGIADMNTFASIADAEAELARVRADLAEARAVTAALIASAPQAPPNGRVVLDNAALSAIRDEALRATAPPWPRKPRAAPAPPGRPHSGCRKRGRARRAVFRSSDPQAYIAMLEAALAEQDRELSAARSALAETTAALETIRRERDLDRERVEASVVREMVCVIELAEARKAGDGWKAMAEAGVAAGRA